MSYNVPDPSTLETAGDKLTQKNPKGHTGRSNTELNSCGIHASSGVHTICNTRYIKIPIFSVTKNLEESVQIKAGC